VTAVELCRDEWGVPHVRADDERSAYFGVGYAHAEDQLELLLRNYLSLRAEEASVFGGAFVDRDFERLRWRHLEEARAALPQLPAGLRDVLDGFVAGVRHYIEAHPERVPAWAPPLEPALPLAIYRSYLWSYMIGDALASLVAAGVTLADEVLAECQAAVPGSSASNEWFLAPSRTADGVTALLSDPHGSIEHFPMFEAHVTTPDLALTGFAAIGAAVLLLGHNRDVAWGMTTGAPRVSDAYAFDRGRTDVQAVVARVGDVERTFEYLVHNGIRCPIVADDGGTVYAICTPYMHDGAGIDVAVYGLGHATNVAEARAAFSGLGMFPQNVMVADRDGGCWYVRAGRVPKRPLHVDYTRPLDGHDEKTAWQGVHSLADLVQIDGAPEGYLQNCNVAPDTMFAGAEASPLGASNYAPYLFNVEPGMTHSRGARAIELLSECEAASIADLQAIATDEYWVGTDQYLGELRAALTGPAPELDELLAFDGHAAAGSRAALQFALWREQVVAGADVVDAARQAVAAAGADTYGDRHRIRRGTRSWPGRAGFLPLTPDLVTNADIVAPLRVMSFGPPDAEGVRWEAGGGRSLRLTTLGGERTRSWAVVLYGQSGVPGSPHYDDQIALYSERRLRDTRFDDSTLWTDAGVITLAVTV
jgi:acyl-homoserine lactone acylase PvdQ